MIPQFDELYKRAETMYQLCWELSGLYKTLANTQERIDKAEQELQSLREGAECKKDIRCRADALMLERARENACTQEPSEGTVPWTTARQVLAILRTSKTPMTEGAIAEALGWGNTKANAKRVYNVLYRLRRAGEVVRSPAGLYSYVSVLS